MGRSLGGLVCRSIALVVAVLVATTSALVVVPGAPASAQIPPPAAPTPPAFHVRLTGDGFVPDRITVAPGQSVVFANDSGVSRSIDSGGDGAFDSGTILPDGRYVLALPTVGTWIAVDDAGPTPHRAVLTVGRQTLDGNPSDPANSAIADLDAPDPAVLVHPELGIEVSRNRILVSFTSSATVAQANAALAAVGLTIVGGNRDVELLITEVADAGTPTLEYMQQALDVLRLQPGVRTAAYDVSLNPNTALPRPADPDPMPGTLGQPTYTWEALFFEDDTIRGVGANYGLESARFPQAWNWLDAVQQVTPIDRAASATIVLDAGFDTGHPDITNVTLERLCTAGGRCTDNRTGVRANGTSRTAHGTATAGVVGAIFDRGPDTSSNSLGTVGGDPASDVHVVPYFTDETRDSTNTVSFASFASVLDLVLDKKNQPPFDFSHLRVINLSAGFFFPTDAARVPIFERLYGNALCGPGDDDDATVPAEQRVACTPNTTDSYLREFRAAAELVRPLADRLAANNVLLVVAAGNDSKSFCSTRPRPDQAVACTEWAPIDVANTDAFGYLSSIWTTGVPPWVLVEGNVATTFFLQRSPFSNVGGTISAAGSVVAPVVDAAGTATYEQIEGTSFSAPLVSAAAGMLSALSPSWSTVRSLLVDRGAIDLADSPTPRLDVYASMLGLPAAQGIDALLDVNDTSPDGNRRVTRDDRGIPTGQDTVLGSTLLGTAWSAPDGRIDMRDFRRFRDGWLDFCSEGPGCPAREGIELDGDEFHPKKDLNLDGCFILQNVPQCNYLESTFSRVDFNGDGTLLDRAIPTLLNANGTPAARGAGTRMTDLDVFSTRFGQGPNADTEGWTAADLPDLLSSADIELRLDTLWSGGVESAEITVGTATRLGPRLTVTPHGPGDVRIYTMPVDPIPELGNADLLTVRVVATLLGGEFVSVYVSPLLEAKAGQDLVVTPCAGQLSVSADPPVATPGGQTLISATLQDCLGAPVANSPIDFEISAGPDGSTISVVNAVTDAQRRCPHRVHGTPTASTPPPR